MATHLGQWQLGFLMGRFKSKTEERNPAPLLK